MHDTRPAPGEIIGYRKDGRAIRLQAGGSEAAVEAPPAPPAAPPAPPAPQPPPAPAPPQQQAPPAPAQAPAPAQPPAPQAPAEPDWKALAETARQETATAKAEADRWKAQSRTQEQRSKANHAELKNRDAVLRQIAEKVGIEFDDKPDPEELTRKLDEARTVARQRSVELAVYTTAAGTGGNALAILDSREFMDRTAVLDPDAADFPSQVAALVQEAVKQPRYQFQQVPTAQVTQPPAQQQPPAQPPAPPAAPQPPAPASGADFSGAPGGNRLWTDADYAYWTAPGRDRDGAVMAKAIEDGLLANLGIGRPSKTARRRR